MRTRRGRKGQWTLTSWLAAFVLLAAFGLPRTAHGAVCNGAFDILQRGFCSTTTNQGCDTAADCPAGETCKTFNFFDPGDPKANGGNKLRVNLAIGAGSISVGTPPQLTVNRIRFDLACVANTGGPPCTPQANVVQYGGDATIATDCGVTWTSSSGANTNEIVFTASQPIVIAQGCSPRGATGCGNCQLEFTILVQGQEPAGSDATPLVVEEVAGYNNGSGDATCSPTLQSGTGQTADLPICPSCTLDQCNLGCDQTVGTCTPQPASTPCADTDGNACTTAGCNGQGVCDQNHSAKVCPPADECNGVCDTTSGQCTPKTSTPCTDTDGNVCTTAGCEISGTNPDLGVCVQTHMFASNSTPCPDTDNDSCTTAGCNGQGVCDQSHMQCVKALGCRVTGGGTVDACGSGDSGCDPNTPGSCAPDSCASPALEATHGGQVGGSIGVATAFTPDSACIAGEWTHVRHIRPGLFGNFHARSFDSLMCACLPCPENPDVPGVVGSLCNPGDRICGPEPRRAPANKICFSGAGNYAPTNGPRAGRSVVFRVDVEDRSEPGGTNGPPPPDRYRIRIWFVPADTSDGQALRAEVACADPTTEELTNAPPPDIDDGGDLIRGNQQIHPPLSQTCTPAHRRRKRAGL